MEKEKISSKQYELRVHKIATRWLEENKYPKFGWRVRKWQNQEFLKHTGSDPTPLTAEEIEGQVDTYEYAKAEVEKFLAPYVEIVPDAVAQKAYAEKLKKADEFFKRVGVDPIQKELGDYEDKKLVAMSHPDEK